MSSSLMPFPNPAPQSSTPDGRVNHSELRLPPMLPNPPNVGNQMLPPLRESEIYSFGLSPSAVTTGDRHAPTIVELLSQQLSGTDSEGIQLGPTSASTPMAFSPPGSHSYHPPTLASYPGSREVGDIQAYGTRYDSSTPLERRSTRPSLNNNLQHRLQVDARIPFSTIISPSHTSHHTANTLPRPGSMPPALPSSSHAPHPAVRHAYGRQQRTHLAAASHQSTYALHAAQPSNSQLSAPVTRASAYSSRELVHLIRASERPMIDWSLVGPGQKLWLISRAVIAKFGRHVTVEDVRAAGMVPHIVTCAPRSNEYSDRLKERNHIISISVDGKPGVSIAQLISIKGNENEPAFLDGGSDAVFEKFGWRTTKLKFDWPGLTERPQGIEEDVPVMTRSKFAYLAASSIEVAVRRATYHPKFQTINDATKQWDLRCLDLNKVQLLSLNYYKKVWIPILALDVD